MENHVNAWKSTEIHESLLKSMKILGILWKSMKIYNNIWKSMKPMNMYARYVFRKKKMGYILYSKNINASHICPPKRNKLFKQRKWKSSLRENMDSEVQNTGQSHSFDENLKWSHGHYGHVAPAGFPQNHYQSRVFDKSVDFHSSKTLLGVELN